MESIDQWSAGPDPCYYGPDHLCQFDYLVVATINPDEYMAYLNAGWRRFGHMLFRQNCSGLTACRSLRVDTDRFRPDRSQRRARKANESAVRLTIGAPAISPAKISLFERFHTDRSEIRGWSPYDPGDLAAFASSFALNPFPTQEWCYFVDQVLVGVGYVDVLAGGLSAIYFVRDPTYRDRSLGTWNVLNLLDQASSLNLPHVYLGYYLEDCPSLRYKASFRPHECLGPDGVWRDGGK